MKTRLFVVLVFIAAAVFLYQYLYKNIPVYPVNFPGPRTHFDSKKLPPAPDYRNKENWMMMPDGSGEYLTDVFWVYPTVYSSKEHWNMPLNDEHTKEKAKKATLKFMGVFSNASNVYAPYYRQAGIAVLSADESDNKKVLGIATKDVENAFKYYMSNANDGKPFIIAGHSQGANIILSIMKDLFSDASIRKNLVAAYIIGWSVTQEDLKKYPFLKIAKTPDETGGIITYNTVADGFVDKAPTILDGAVVVNPLTWTISAEPAPASLNEGAVFFDADMKESIIPHYTSAQIKGEGLVIPRLANEDQLDMPFGPGVYHNYDYFFFYENIRQNVAKRIRSFLEKERQ
ncbi:MAG: DUF3089 domain-containing protein [Candidatus Omnitrophota bacterium]